MAKPLPSPLVEALHRISSNINTSTGLAHPNDMEHSVKWLSEAIQGMSEASHPDDIADYLVSLGQLRSETADEVAIVYQALWCHIKGKSPFA